MNDAYSKIAGALMISGILGIIGAIWDFQGVKADVAKQQAVYELLYEEVKEIRKDVKKLLQKME